MANDFTVVIPRLLAQGLMALREQAFMPQIINRGYESMAGERGSTIDIPIPSAIAVQDVAPAATPPSTADVTPTMVSITMNKWKEAPFYLTDKDQLEIMAGTIPMQASEAIKALANQVNTDILALYVEVFGYVGTAATTPLAGSTADATNTRKTLNKQLSPMTDRRFVVDPDAEANALNLQAFQDNSWRGDAEGIREAQIGRKLGFDWYMHQLVPTHTTGAAVSYLVDNGSGLVVGVKTAAIDTGTGAWVVGDIITFAGHSQTYTITGSTGGASATNITFYPGLKATVANNALITKKATHVVNLAFHRDAFAFASRPLDRPQGLGSVIETAVDPVSQLALRLEVTREHKRIRYSYDILYGCKTVRPEYACRLAG